MRKNSKDEQEDIGLFIGAAVRGLAVGLSTALILSLIFTALLLGMEDPERFLAVFAMTTLFIGAAAGGFAAGIFERGRTAGILCGAAYTLVIWCVSLFLRSGETNLLMSAAGYILCVAVSSLAGIISGRGRSVNRGPNAARRKKARRRA